MNDRELLEWIKRDAEKSSTMLSIAIIYTLVAIVACLLIVWFWH